LEELERATLASPRRDIKRVGPMPAMGDPVTERHGPRRLCPGFEGLKPIVFAGTGFPVLPTSTSRCAMRSETAN